MSLDLLQPIGAQQTLAFVQVLELGASLLKIQIKLSCWKEVFMKNLIFIFFSILVAGCSSKVISERQPAQSSEVNTAGFYSDNEISASNLNAKDIPQGSTLDFTSFKSEILIHKGGSACTLIYADARDDAQKGVCWVCLKSPPNKTLSFPREKFEVSNVDSYTEKQTIGGLQHEFNHERFHFKTSRGNEASVQCRSMYQASTVHSNLKSVGIVFKILKPEQAELHGPDESTNTVTKKEKILKRVPAAKK